MKINVSLLVSISSLVLFLSACSNSPNLTDSVNIKDVPDGYTAVSVCHSNDPSEKVLIESLSMNQCPDGTNKLFLWDEDIIMNSCVITKRIRTTFLCTQ